MEFGWINLFGAIIVILMLIPNAVYAAKNRHQGNKDQNKILTACEQIGRYGCMILMWLPLPVLTFGFSGTELFLIYLLGNGLLLLTYLIIWALYFKNQTHWKAMALAIIPTCIFLLSGLTLSHWLLVLFAVLFGVGHIFITYQNRG